ncbi:alanine/glycine:cation symporter family protein [Anaeromicrobium sediminis]|uniref:Sodium:alanine symporter family protein n=1 Tax=Anaeromicrobium sediminis TaxID=1478221 RepID=A0A267MJL7_9FIRM|nr:sodium:alanine symporter family protein [Anaeromicrobium sediminis]PAB59647.1 sodium:alanine symporter family protein [Anaeromicrobium sediminis]
MEKLTEILNQVDSFVWGPPLLILLVATGMYLTFKLGFIQILKLPLAIKYLFSKEKSNNEAQGDISSFAALCTALAATIGTGNIVGVATAIKVGGPGALFWMWIAAFFGMATKYAEGLLAVKYRTVDNNGEISGGPMYYIENGLGKEYRWLGKMFALFGVGVAFFGIGTFPQVNAITNAANLAFNIPTIVTSIILTILVAAVTLGGIKSISKISEMIVPFMALFYILGCLIIIFMNVHALPQAISFILTSAFSGKAATGGFVGATVMMAIRNGIARGVFSNESGLGSAPIAAAAAKTNSCVRQGLVSMTGTFFDTIIVCTMTGIVLIMTGAWSSEYAGAAMTNYAFSIGMPMFGKWIVTIGLTFFAFTTILGWNYYGERCTEYLVGVKGIKPFKYIYILLVACGAFLKLDMIWVLADIVNGLMAIPNLIALILLSKVISSETKKYFNSLEKNAMKKIAS